MLLVIDVGNSNTVFGVARPKGEWAAQWRLSTLRTGIGNDWAPAIATLASHHRVDITSITAVCICSVVPAATSAITEYVQQFLGIEPRIITANLQLNISLGMDSPTEVGSDRIANAAAAWDRCRTACIVVDLGTATKVEAISSTGEFLGGAIATGLSVSIEALTARAAKLFVIDLVAPRSAIGRNTTEALQAGLVRGHFHLISGLITDFRTKLGDDAPVLVTGGHAAREDSPFRTLGQYEPDLTLDGIRLIHALNCSPRMLDA